jgi:hypothetical protein
MRQPTMRRLNTSRTTARYNTPDRVVMYVISAVHRVLSAMEMEAIWIPGSEEGCNCVDQLRGLRVGIDNSMVETRHQELSTGRRDRDRYSNDDPAATETLRRVGTKRKE